MMPDFGISVGLELDTSAYEEGIARAEAMLRLMGDEMNGAVSETQRLSAEVAGVWSGINDSIQQAMERVQRLMSMSQAASAGQQAGSALDAMAGLVSKAVSGAVSGLSIQLDGEAVGNLVAPTVNRQIAQEASAWRYTR